MKCLLLLAICCVVIPVYGQKPAEKAKTHHQHTTNTQTPKNDTINVDTLNVNKLNVAEQTNTSGKPDQNTHKPPSYFDRLITPENLPNLILSILGIIGIMVAICTLLVIRRQTNLQAAAMRQWATTGKWIQWPRAENGVLVEIILQIPILNETNYPLQLDSVVGELNGIEQIKIVRSQIAPLGKDPHCLTFPLRLDGHQVSEYQQNRFILVVECRVTFVDVLKDKQTMMFNRLYRCGPQEFEQKDQYIQTNSPN